MKGQHSSSADSASTDTSISVPSDLHGCHPLISQTRKALEQEKPDEGHPALNAEAHLERDR
jgi:hypothetical protein